MPTHASFLYARNVANVLGLMGPEGTLAPDWDDEIVAGMCVLRDGAAVAPAAVELLGRDGRWDGGCDTRSAVVIAFAAGVVADGRVDHRDRRVPDHLRPGGLRRDRGRLEGAEHPAHPADVGVQRHPRHRAGRRADDHGRGPRHGPGRPRLPGRLPGHPERGGRLRGHRPHARDVQGQAGRPGAGRRPPRRRTRRRTPPPPRRRPSPAGAPPDAGGLLHADDRARPGLPGRHRRLHLRPQGPELAHATPGGATWSARRRPPSPSP